MVNVFISYRRDDAGGHAGRLADRLIARFGGDRVFMDVQDIKPGQNFEQAIDQTLGRCDHLLAVIGPRWLESLNARAASREDFVRSEIGMALARGVTVIPVLVGGARMPAGDQLPEPLAAFSRCNAVEVRDSHFDADAAWLVQFLAGGPQAAPAAGVSRRVIAVAVPLVVVAALLAWWATSPGSEDVTPVKRELPSMSYGTWTLREAKDDAGQDWSNSVLQFTSQEETDDGLALRGRFTWRLDNDLMGSEEVEGRYIERTRQVILEGTVVDDAEHGKPQRLAVGSYSAILADDERALLSGRWGSTQTDPGSAGEWEAVR
jgi:hypothetical protein